MNILKMKFHSQDEWKSLKTFWFWMWAFGDFASWCDLWDEDEDECTDKVMFNYDVAGVSGERDVD